MSAGWIAGIVGTVIGVMAGIVGTYFSVKNTNGPRERAFMLKGSAVCWIVVILFLGAMFVVPFPYCDFLWIPYAILLVLGITYGNRKQQSIRDEESRG